MLTESRALALLARYCAPLRTAVWTGGDRCVYWTDAVYEHVDVVVNASLLDSGTTDDTTDDTRRERGAELRLAFGVAQAVSCCRGFAPESNASFWHRVVAVDYQVPTPMFSRTAFDNVGLEWCSYKSDGSAFWSGFLHGTRASDAALASVLDELRPHLARHRQPLRVALSYTWGLASTPFAPALSVQALARLPMPLRIETVVSLEALQMILRAVLAPQSYVWSCGAVTQVGLVVDFHDDHTPAFTRETLALLMHAHTTRLPRHVKLTVDRLDLQLAMLAPRWCPPPHGRSYRRALVTKVRKLGHVLRTLLLDANAPRVHTVALKGCSHSDFRLVGAALSAVAWASPSVQELRCRGLFYASQPHEQLQRLAWLAYTLHCRRRRGQSPLALSLVSACVALSDAESTYMQELLVRGTPLRDVVGESLRVRFGGNDGHVARLRVECLRFGSTARLARGTKLFLEPFRVDDECVVVTTDSHPDDELELVAHAVDDHAGVFVGVVYAGYGLVWTTAASVVTWHGIHDADDVAMVQDDHGEGTLSALVLNFEGQVGFPHARASDAYRVSATLPLLVGPTLRVLTVNHTMVLCRDLTHILECCRGLHSLSLDRCMIESVAPLVVAYENHTTRVAVLSLLGVLDLFMHQQLVHAQSIPPEHYLELVRGEEPPVPMWTSAFVDALVNGVARGVLRELHVDVQQIATVDDECAVVARLANAVVSGALTLDRLHVSCQYEVEETSGVLLGPLDGVVLKDPRRERCATLSVLRTFGCAPCEIAGIVLAMADERIVRIVTWDSNDNWRWIGVW